ncbi:MAG: DUF29 domain-containing protein [Phormidesmis sp.]
MKKSSLYETDFYAWTQEQAELIALGRWSRLDAPNLVEEIESLGSKERPELRNRLGILLGHLLKWQFQPERRSNSWRGTIREQRKQINLLLKDSPSLKPYLQEALPDAYELGTALAMKETQLAEETFSENCPYSLADILETNFFPTARPE